MEKYSIMSITKQIGVSVTESGYKLFVRIFREMY
jgi:hypothetical protein